MMPLEVGKLYSCSEYLLLYPDRETAVAAVAGSDFVEMFVGVGAAHRSAVAHRSAATAAWRAEASCSYWSNQFDKPVNYYNPQTPLLVLSVKEEYIQVLAGNQKGWIIYRDWLNIKDIR